MGIYIVLLATVGVIVFRQPAAALGALLCTYGLEQWAQAQSEFFYTHQLFTNLATAGIVGMALVLRVLQGRPTFAPVTREFWVAAALYALAGLSVIWSVARAETWANYTHGMQLVLLFGFLSAMCVADRGDLKVSMYVLLSLGSVICALLLIDGEWANRGIVFKTGASIGLVGLSRGNPLAIATFGGQVALVAWLMNFRGVGRFWQVLRYVVIGMGFALSVKSGSRGQTVAIVIAAIAFLPYSRRFRDVKSFLSFAISLVIFSTIVLVLFESLTRDSRDGTTADDRWSFDSFVGAYEGGRVGQAAILLSHWARAGPFYWLVGLGSSASYDPQILGFYPHVVFAEVLGELGLVGWAILWLVPIYAYQNLRELWTYVRDDPEDRGLVATMGALLLFDVILSFKQGSLLGAGSAFAFSIILGRVNRSYRAEAARLAEIDAGGYAMSPDDWEHDEEPEPNARPELAMGRA